MARLRKRTMRKKTRGGAPWGAHNWPGGPQQNATYYPLNSYGGQIDRALRYNVGGSRRKRFKR